LRAPAGTILVFYELTGGLPVNWEAIGAAGEILGAIAVLVTLVFLANQIRQNNSIGKAEAEREWFATWHGLVRETMGSPEAVELLRQGLDHYANMSVDEKAIFSTRMIAMFDHVDVLRRLHQKGFVDDDMLDPILGVLSSIAATPGGDQWWREIGPVLSISDYFDEHRDVEATPITAMVPYLQR
jgi:hypothetical protein